MIKRWALLVFILLIATFSTWWHIKSGVAKEEEKETLAITKPERKYSIKLSKKLDEVLVNQEKILKEIEELKDEIKKVIRR